MQQKNISSSSFERHYCRINGRRIDAVRGSRAGTRTSAGAATTQRKPTGTAPHQSCSLWQLRTNVKRTCNSSARRVCRKAWTQKGTGHNNIISSREAQAWASAARYRRERKIFFFFFLFWNFFLLPPPTEHIFLLQTLFLASASLHSLN